MNDNLPAKREPSWEETNNRIKLRLKWRIRKLKRAAVNVALFPFRALKWLWEVIF